MYLSFENQLSLYPILPCCCLLDFLLNNTTGDFLPLLLKWGQQKGWVAQHISWGQSPIGYIYDLQSMSNDLRNFKQSNKQTKCSPTTLVMIKHLWWSNGLHWMNSFLLEFSWCAGKKEMEFTAVYNTFFTYFIQVFTSQI